MDIHDFANIRHVVEKKNYVAYRNHVMVAQIHILVDFVLYIKHVMEALIKHHTDFVYAEI